jgi:phosphopantothenoylcysteine decarboxylase
MTMTIKSKHKKTSLLRYGLTPMMAVEYPPMNAIPGRTVVLGVTGSIAAHRAVDLASLLVKEGCDVHVVMTAEAQRFVMPLPFKTLSRHAVLTGLWEDATGWQPPHIELADQARLLVVAPATALFLAKYAHGLADDALHCIALALNPQAKVLVAPAMNGKMWLHPATQANVGLLRDRGVEFMGPDQGLLACGYEGVGRMWGVEAIATRALALLTSPSTPPAATEADAAARPHSEG